MNKHSQNQLSAYSIPKRLCCLLLCAIVLLWTIALSHPLSASAASVSAADFSESSEIASAYFTDLKTVIHYVQGGVMNGEPAYCLEYQRPSPKGVHYTNGITVGKNVQYCLRYGYPNNSANIAGKPLNTTTEAYLATKMAIWRSAQDNPGFTAIKINLSNLHPKNAAGTRILAAAIALYNAAKSGYVVPPAPAHPSPTFNLPSANEKTLIPDPNRPTAYQLAGPFSANIPTASHIEAGKFNAALTGAPDGSYIGNATGTQISSFAQGTKYYIFIPADATKLQSPDSAKVALTASYNYQYETALDVTAFSSTRAQNMAIAARPSFKSAAVSANASFDVTWTNLDILKIDTNNAPIPDTEFELAYKNGASWVVLGKMTSDKDGKINWPGLGLGDYKLTETRPNPDFMLPEEHGEPNSKEFSITSTSSPMLQTFTNEAISTGCEVDIDTINLTSAAYRSLAGEEDFDNVDSETYHYDIDYRSIANTFADEFVVDDPLDAVNKGLIRINTLWTAVSWGDNDGMMNVWYKTNLTEADKNYSDKSAMSTNPANPNNPSKKPAYPNTGYKLWASDVSTESQTSLNVSDLGLDDNEYITAVRYEHGRVNRGFTTKNYSSLSKNHIDESVLANAIDATSVSSSTNLDWTPKISDAYYSAAALEAQGLRPVTYLVTCPEPLDSSTLIVNRVTANIARNVVLSDQDSDIVGTYPIETFTVTPKVAPPKFEHKIYGLEDYKKFGIIPKTSDGFPIIPILLACFGALLTGILIVLMRGKLKHFKVICMVMAVTTAGMFTMGTVTVFAGSDDGTKEFTYTVSGEIDTNSYDTSDGKNSFEPKVYIDNGRYKGFVYLKKVTSTPNYKSFERKVDKTKVYPELDEEEVLYLPDKADFELTTDTGIDSKKTVSLKRAGLKLEITGETSQGIPCEWEATAVFRGLEQYLDVHSYSSEATYSGKLSKK